MNKMRDMLITNRDQFAIYATHHRNKVQSFARDQSIYAEGSSEWCKYQGQIDETVQKAEANEQMVRDIQAVLNEAPIDILSQTAKFAEIAYAEGVTGKNQQTQLGVHFEEVSEMIEQVKSKDIATLEYLGAAETALVALANHLKTSEPTIFIRDRLAFLDACCDQLVTSTLSAVLYDMDPVGGLNEVNRSNYSKLVNGVMQKAPVTMKWLKGPNYTEPDLTPFI